MDRILIVFVLVGVYVLLGSASRRTLENQIFNLKIKLSELAKKTGNDDYAVYNISDNDIQKIRDLVSQSKKLDAIKLLKENYQMSLVDSKAYVEYIQSK